MSGRARGGGRRAASSSPNYSHSPNYNHNLHYRDKSDADNDSNEDDDVANCSASTLIVDVVGESSPRRVRRSPRAQHEEGTKTSPADKHMSKLSPKGVAENFYSCDESLTPDLLKKAFARRPIHESPKDGLRSRVSSSQSSRTTATSFKSVKRSFQKQQVRMEMLRDQEASFIDQWGHWCIICLICVLLLFLVFFVWPLFSSSDEEQIKADSKPSVRERILTRFEQDIPSMMQLFPSQTSRFWRVLKAAVKSVFRESKPAKPAVILIAGPKGSHTTMDCLTARFLTIVSNAYAKDGPTVNFLYDPSKEPEKTAQEVKMHLDHTLKQGLSSGSHSAHIHMLETIPGKAAMMFHAYCDNENAPYKDAAVVFTLETDASKAEDVKDEQVDQYLTQLWSPDLDVDSLTALLSRIANNVATLIPESADTLVKANC